MLPTPAPTAKRAKRKSTLSPIDTEALFIIFPIIMLDEVTLPVRNAPNAPANGVMIGRKRVSDAREIDCIAEGKPEALFPTFTII